MKPPDEISPELQAIEAYVRKRLAKECRMRGAQTRIAELLGFKSAHLSNIIAGRRRVYESMARKLCARWGLTYSDLERIATGAPAASKEEHLPNLRATIEWCRDGYPAGFLSEYERLARLVTADRKRRAWLDDIDKQLRIWADGEVICPLRDPDDQVPRGPGGDAAHEAPPSTRAATDRRVRREGDPSTKRPKVPRARVLKQTG